MFASILSSMQCVSKPNPALEEAEANPALDEAEANPALQDQILEEAMAQVRLSMFKHSRKP
jgi:hypothetical protein